MLRVDSPGGSGLASESIWRNIIRAQENGKKVIGSIGNVAASGGYYILSPCDKIVGQPGSITGSIGVFGGKFIFSNFFEKKLGITTDTIQVGQNANVSSPFHDFSPSEYQLFQKLIDGGYEMFVDRVATGRKLSVDHVLSIGGGRVYTGEAAKQIGLLDEFGGLQKAIEIAKQEAAVPEATVEIIPKRLSALQQIGQLLSGSWQEPSMEQSLSAIIHQHVLSSPLVSSLLPLLEQLNSFSQRESVGISTRADSEDTNRK